jgi:hypothetical protein
MSFSREPYASITGHTGGLRPKPKGGDMPRSKIKIWICFGLALLGCIYPLYPQAPGVRPPPAKPAGKNIKPVQEPFGKELLRGFKPIEELPSEFYLGGKKWDGHQSARAPKALNLTKQSAPPKPYGERNRMLWGRYKNNVEFQKAADQLKAKLIEQGVDKEFLRFLPKHSMLDEHSSVQFVANQSDKDIDESGFYMKKIAKKVLDDAVRNFPLFEFQTELECKSALKDAIKKACDDRNRVEKLPWTLKFKLESDDLVFQSRDDKHPDAELSIGTILSDLANLDRYESIQTAPAEPRAETGVRHS